MKRSYLAAVLALALAGCTSPCIKLAEKICECELTTLDREACERVASNQAANTDLSDADEERCDSYLDTCDCRFLDTAEGKMNCGLANRP